MKRKLSILILAAFCLSTIVIGVYSVKYASVNITGNIEFSVHSPKLNGSEGWEGTWDSSYNITLTGVPASATSGATLEIPEFFYCLDNLKTPASTTTTVNAVVDEDLTIEEELSLLNSQGITWGKGHVKVLGDGTNAIKRMSNYSKINFANVTSTLSSISYRAFYNSNLTSLNLSGTSVTTIGSSAFLNSALTKVELANSSVSTLGNGVFEGNTNLQTVTLSKKITVLPYATFANCKALSTIDLSNITIIGDSCFLNAALSSVNIHNGITSIGAEAFNSCAKLTSLTFGEGSTNLSIGANAFKYCTGIKTLNLPSRLTYMGEDAFANCSAINSITTPFVGQKPVIENFEYDKQYHRVTWSFPTTSLTSITITGGKGNYTLHQYAFNQYSYGNSKFSALKKVTLGANVTTIEPMALGNCSGITYFSSPIFAGYTEGGATSYELWRIFAEPDGSSPKEYGLPTELTFDFTGTDATFANGSLSYCNIVSFTNSTNTLTSIPNSKFSGLSKLTKIFNDGNKIPANVTAIGNYAFQNCTSLTNVDMSNNKVATLGTYAFSGCSALNNIILSSILTKLQDYTFQNCTSLQTVNMKNIALTELGASIFSSCTALQMVDMRNSDITTLGSRIFYGCSKLQNVYLSSKTKVLPDRAFMNCTVLNMPDISNVISLGNYCFASCKAISSVTIHNKLESIANYCFANCTSLSSLAFEEGSVALSIGYRVFLRNAITSVTLPQRLVSMSYGIFDGCEQLTSISTPFVGTKSSFDSSYNFSTGVEHKFLYLFSKNASASTVNSTTLPASLKSVTINGVCDIAKDAFTYTTTENGATVNKGVDITSLTIGNKVKSIGINAFGNCKSLQTVTFNDYTGSDYDANKLIVYEDAFHSCTSLVSVNIPYRMYSLGDGAFANCTALSSLTFANRSNSQNLTLGEYCFKNNDALTTLTIPTNVINIPEGAFYDCDILKTINLPNDLQTVGKQAFYNCVKLSSISFPASTYMIGYQSFFQCYALGSITFDSQIDGLSIHDQAFCGSGIESIVIPDGTKEIGANVFQSCGSLKSITLPFVGGGYISDASVKPEGYDKFNYILNSNANQITNVTITGNIAWDGGISKIYSNAFAGLTNLQTVTIGNGVKIISLGAFSGCTGITTMTIPFTGESADASDDFPGGTSHFTYIFGADTINTDVSSVVNVQTVTFNSQKLSKFAFYKCSSIQTILTPNYSSSNLAYYSFYDCSKLTTVFDTNNNLPNSVTTIDSGSFSGCTELTKINNIKFVTLIDDIAFNGCQKLNLDFTKAINLEKINMLAFKNCSALSNLDLTNSKITTLGARAFERCSSIETITLPNSLTSIGEEIFNYCTSLQSITLPFVGLTPTNNETTTSVFGVIFSTSTDTGMYPAEQRYIGEGDTASPWLTTTYYIPSSLTKVVITGSYDLPYGSFFGVSSLKEINFTGNVNKFNKSVCEGCTSLTKVVLPVTIEILSRGCFWACQNLTDINLEECTKLTSLGLDLFGNCTALTDLTIPANVTTYGISILYGCTGLKNLTMPWKYNNNTESLSCFGRIFAPSSTSSALQSYVPASLTNLTINDYDIIPASTFTSVNISGTCKFTGTNGGQIQSMPGCDTLELYGNPSIGKESSYLVYSYSTISKFNIYNSPTIANSIYFHNISTVYIDENATPIFGENIFTLDSFKLVINNTTWMNDTNQSKNAIYNVSNFYYISSTIPSTYSSWFDNSGTETISNYGSFSKYTFKDYKNRPIYYEKTTVSGNYVVSELGDILWMISTGDSSATIPFRMYRKTYDGFAYCFLVRVKNDSNYWTFPLLISPVSSNAAQLNMNYKDSGASSETWHAAGTKSFTWCGETWYCSVNSGAWSDPNNNLADASQSGRPFINFVGNSSVDQFDTASLSKYILENNIMTITYNSSKKIRSYYDTISALTSSSSMSSKTLTTRKKRYGSYVYNPLKDPVALPSSDSNTISATKRTKYSDTTSGAVCLINWGDKL